MTNQDKESNSSELDQAYWNSRYKESKTGWDRGGAHPALEHWLESDQLPPCKIAVPGCGNGHEVIELAKRGFQVTAIDFASLPLWKLENELGEFKPNANLVRSDLFEFTPKERFDAVYEQTCLCAIEPKFRVDYERTIHQWLRPKGILFALFMQAEQVSQGPPFHCHPDEMKELFPSERWTWDPEPFSKHQHPMGEIFEFATRLVRN